MLRYSNIFDKGFDVCDKEDIYQLITNLLRMNKYEGNKPITNLLRIYEYEDKVFKRCGCFPQLLC